MGIVYNDAVKFCYYNHKQIFSFSWYAHVNLKSFLLFFSSIPQLCDFSRGVLLEIIICWTHSIDDLDLYHLANIDSFHE